MTDKYRPNKDDRVRVTVEGNVNYVDHRNTYFEVAGLGFYPGEGILISVERIDPPLPTTPGSVVKDGGQTLLRIRDGWVDDSGYTFSIKCQFSKNVEVIYDAGAQK